MNGQLVVCIAAGASTEAQMGELDTRHAFFMVW
eukprot:COSAG06_NODE_62734_length_264_cov_0.630303_1_plen_32_part_10